MEDVMDDGRGPGGLEAREPDGAAALAAHLAAAPSVTAGLQSWCEARGIGEGPVRVLAREEGAPPAALAALLGAGAGEAVETRRVVLGRAAIALADAEIAYRPRLLTAPMREALAAGEDPFGSIVAPLAPRRVTVSLSHRPAAQPAVVLAIRALLVLPGGEALAAVSERFRPVLVDRNGGLSTRG